MEEFSIPLLPDGENIHKLIFNSKEEKDSYVKGEYQFCFAERAMYLSCRFKEVEQAQKDLDDRRVEFAKRNGFTPSKYKPRVWERVEQEDLIA